MNLPVEAASWKSLRVDMVFDDLDLAHGTGLLVEHDGITFLVTTWHNVTGLHAETHEYLHKMKAVPNRLRVWFATADLAGHAPIHIDLYAEGAALWREHPDHGSKVDLVAIPLQADERLAYKTHGLLANPHGVTAPVESDVCLVGFPYGVTSGGALPVWIRGMISSEPELDFEFLPRFLVDARTRKGSSGSPCLLYEPTGIVKLKAGGTIAGVDIEVLLGVYSGRIDEKSDLGYVWKAGAVAKVVEEGVPGGSPKAPA